MPQRTVTVIIRTATGRSTTKLHAESPAASTSPCATGAAPIAASSHHGRNDATNGTTFAVKNGIIRWQTITNTGSRNIHTPSRRTTACAAGPAIAKTATPAPPAASASATSLACTLSATVLARISETNRRSSTAHASA